MIPVNNLSTDDKNKIVDMYYSHKDWTFDKIADTLGYSRRSVPRVLNELGINTKLKNRYTISNPTYFSEIDTEFKAYILGFIYADGFVGLHNNFVLSLSHKCEDNYKILNHLREEIGLSMGVKHTYTNDGYGHYTLNISNKQIVEDLNKQGVFTCKSLTMENMPNLSNDLYHHFIRGYFDGDGSICTYYEKAHNAQRYCMEILGTPLFLDKFQKILCEQAGVNPTKLHNVNHVEGLTRISHRGIRNLIRIRDYLYHDATYYITYKRDRFFSIAPLSRDV